MSCKFASLNPNAPFYSLPKPNKPTDFFIHESISFASQLSNSGISIKNPFGPCRAARIEALYAPTEESLYELLGIVESGSSLSDIKKAYKRMARLYHPDVSPPERVDEHTRRFMMVKEAYEILSDPRRRDLYDRDLANGLGLGLDLGFNTSDKKRPFRDGQEMEEKGEWKMRWQSQLTELKRRSKNQSRGKMSRGVRMRSHT